MSAGAGSLACPGMGISKPSVLNERPSKSAAYGYKRMQHTLATAPHPGLGQRGMLGGLATHAPALSGERRFV